MKPVFKVLYDNFNKSQIEYVNWFDFGQWTTIKKELTGLKKKIVKNFKDKDFKDKSTQDELKKFFEKNLWNVEFKKCKNIDELIDYTLEERLRKDCTYYFWAKCEYEVIVSAWPPKDGVERKIDIYTQLTENWDVFKELVFNEVK